MIARQGLRAAQGRYQPVVRLFIDANQPRTVSHCLARPSSSRSGTQGRQATGSSAWTTAVGLGGLLTVTALLSSQHRELQSEAPPLSKEELGAFRLDPATSQPLPVTLPKPQTPLPSGCKELKLVGLGVRTVSFLSIRVYVAGLYVDSAALQTLESVPGWKGFEAGWMQGKDKEHSAEALVSALLDRGVTCAVRIDYNHLRDGFTRAIQGRAKLARKANLLSAEADEALSRSLQDLKEAFPRASLPKGKALDLIFTPSGQAMDLALEEDNKVLGQIKAPQNADGQYTVARQLLLAYLADKDEISKPFKASVAEGFEHVLRG